MKTTKYRFEKTAKERPIYWGAPLKENLSGRPMKPKPSGSDDRAKGARKLPRAYDTMHEFMWTENGDTKYFPVTVLPAATQSEARAIAAFHNLSGEEKVEAIARAIGSTSPKHPSDDWVLRVARAILSLLNGGRKT